MPMHVYSPRNDPPTFLDRLLVHSTEVGLGVLSASASVQVLLTPLFKEYAPSQSLKAVDPFMGLLLAVFLGIGGTLAVIGVLWTGSKISTGWLLEQSGWLLAGTAWTGYAALVAYSFPFSTISYSIAGALGLVCWFRAYVVWRIDRSVRPGAEAVRTLRKSGGEG